MTMSHVLYKLDPALSLADPPRRRRRERGILRGRDR